MTITTTRARSHKMRHTATVRQHTIALDEPASNGGEDLGVGPHDLYDGALGACKALTVLWYAQRKQIPVEDIQVSVERDDADERKGVYRLRTTLSLGGALTFQQERRDNLVLASATPSALAAFSDGTTLLVYANAASAPSAGAWTNYRVSLDAGAAGWFVGSAGGAAATPEQLQRVLGNLSQLVIAGEWFDGAVSTGQPETIALDNVILSGVDDGTPVPLPGTLALFAAPALLRLRRGRL